MSSRTNRMIAMVKPNTRTANMKHVKYKSSETRVLRSGKIISGKYLSVYTFTNKNIRYFLIIETVY